MGIYAIGIDVGGTKTNFATIDHEGNLVFSHKYVSKDIFSIAADPAVSMEKTINAFCRTYSIDLPKVKGVVIGVPGKIDPTSQIITRRALKNPQLG